MVYPTDYKAYHIMKAIGPFGATASKVAERYNEGLGGGNKPVNSNSVAQLIRIKLIPSYVEVRRREKPWKHSHRTRAVYGLTQQGLEWVERWAHRWET